MVYGRTPFETIAHPVAKMNAIVTATVHYPELPVDFQNSGILSLLKSCFEMNYKLRPDASDLLQHPFLCNS